MISFRLGSCWLAGTFIFQVPAVSFPLHLPFLARMFYLFPFDTLYRRSESPPVDPSNRLLRKWKASQSAVWAKLCWAEVYLWEGWFGRKTSIVDLSGNKTRYLRTKLSELISVWFALDLIFWGVNWSWKRNWFGKHTLLHLYIHKWNN